MGNCSDAETGAVVDSDSNGWVSGALGVDFSFASSFSVLGLSQKFNTRYPPTISTTANPAVKR
jgi:hypothetical protein